MCFKTVLSLHNARSLFRAGILPIARFSSIFTFFWIVPLLIFSVIVFWDRLRRRHRRGYGGSETNIHFLSTVVFLYQRYLTYSANRGLAPMKNCPIFKKRSWLPPTSTCMSARFLFIVFELAEKAVFCIITWWFFSLRVITIFPCGYAISAIIPGMSLFSPFFVV